MLSKRRVQKGWFRSSVMAPRASQTRSVPQHASLSTVRDVHRQNRCLTADGATLHACHNSLSPLTARWGLYYSQWSLRCDGNPPSSLVRPLAGRLYLRPGCEAEARNPEQKAHLALSWNSSDKSSRLPHGQGEKKVDGAVARRCRHAPSRVFVVGFLSRVDLPPPCSGHSAAWGKLPSQNRSRPEDQRPFVCCEKGVSAILVQKERI